MRVVATWGLVVGLAACGDDASAPRDAAGDAAGDAAVDAPPDAGVPRYQTIVEVPATPHRELDVLLVIDDSPSMLDKQQRFAAALPDLVAVLDASTPGGFPDLHLGVVTTDVGTLSTGSPTPGPPVGAMGAGGCAGTGKNGELHTFGAPVSGAFLTDVADVGGGRLRNYTGTLTTVVGQMITGAAANGCGFEQPLHAMRRALDANPANAGFVRSSAALGIVILTDEDDCSLASTAVVGTTEPGLGPLNSFRCTRFGVTCATGGATPEEMGAPGPKDGCTAAPASPYLDDTLPYLTFLLGLKGDARKIAVAAVMGDPTPVTIELVAPPGGGPSLPRLAASCMYQGSLGPELAVPGVRLRQFLDRFPARVSRTSVCAPDHGPTLADVGLRMAQALGSPCVGALPDVDPAQPGVQHDCLVEDLVGATTAPIEPCGASGPATCWAFETDAITCPAGDGQKLVVTRPATPDPGTVTRLRCRVP